MSHSQDLSILLGKVLFAAAWADGKIQPQEIDCLKDIIFHLPGIDDQSWVELEHYMSSQIGPDERQELLSQLHEQVENEDDRAFVTQATNRVFMADGVITTEEQEAIREVAYLLKRDSNTGIEGLSEAIRESMKRREEALRRTLRPEEANQLGQGERLQLLLVLENRFAEQGINLDIPQQEKQRLVLFGCLLARVANADEEVAPSEIDVIEQAVKDRWKVSTEVASFITQIIFSEEAQGLDLLRLAREFHEVTTHKDRLDALGVLIDVSRADAVIRHVESVTIHEIAEQLKLTQQDISDAMIDSASREGAQ